MAPIIIIIIINNQLQRPVDYYNWTLLIMKYLRNLSHVAELPTPGSNLESPI